MIHAQHDCLDLHEVIEESADGEPNFKFLWIEERARCTLCLKELLRECFRQNPKWFTPKKKQVSLTHKDKVFQWLRSNCSIQKCVVFKIKTAYESYDESWDEPYETEYCQDYKRLCDKHFKEVVAGLGF